MIFKFYKKDYPDRVHYIMGTMHTRDIYAYSFERMAVHLLSECETYAPEMNILELSTEEIEIQAPVISINEFSDKKVLNLRRKLQKFFDINIVGDIIYPMNIMQLIQERVVPPVFNLPFDHYLLSIANEMKMHIHGLESVHQQLSYLNDMDSSALLDQIFKILKNKPAYHKQMNRLALKYQTADIIYVAKKSAKSLGNMKSLMLFERNINMHQKLVEFTEDSTVFAAVGAGHLGGDKGMLSLLKKDGFTVQALQ
jgi:hypothetical protein